MAFNVTQHTQGNSAYNMAAEIFPKSTCVLDLLISQGVLRSTSDEPALKCSHMIDTAKNLSESVELNWVTAGSLPVFPMQTQLNDGQDFSPTKTRLEFGSIRSYNDMISVSITGRSDRDGYDLTINATTNCVKGVKTGIFGRNVGGSIDFSQLKATGFTDGEISAVLQVVLECRSNQLSIDKTLEVTAEMMVLLSDSKNAQFEPSGYK